jgi:tryptophan 2,3-dioxygenase
MLHRRAVALCLALSLSACAGREAVTVAEFTRQDDQLTCSELDREIGRNNDAMRSRVVEGHDRQGRNIMIGAVGILLFWPALAALDLKDAPGKELEALDARNKALVRYADQRACRVQTALDIPAVKAEYEAKFDKEGNPVESTVVQNDWTPPAAAPRATTAVSQPQTAANSVGRGELKDLMDLFLRGDIDQTEYEQRRIALGL